MDSLTTVWISDRFLDPLREAQREEEVRPRPRRSLQERAGKASRPKEEEDEEKDARMLDPPRRGLLRRQGARPALKLPRAPAR